MVYLGINVGIFADLLAISLPWGKLRGGTGGAKTLPT